MNRSSSPPAATGPARDRAWDGVMLALSVALPAVAAATLAANVPDAAHDEAVVRAVGLGWAGAFRALDAPVAALLAWVPVGTRAFRASLAFALACGGAGGALFTVARAQLAAVADAKRLGAVLAGIGATMATLAVGWQLEASAPGGSALGGALAIAPIALLVARERLDRGRLALAALAAGAALAYEPMVGVAAIAAPVAFLALLRPPPRALVDARGPMIAGAVLGLFPLVVALVAARRVPGLALSVPPFTAPVGETGVSGPGAAVLFLRDDVGVLPSLLAAAGALLAALTPRARPIGAALAAIVLTGLLAMALGAPDGETRYGAPVLAASAALAAFAALGMQALVLAVTRARIPFAAASAAMIVVLLLTFPVLRADESQTRGNERSRGAAAVWDAVAWGPLPAGSLVIASDRRVVTRLVAARAEGRLRGDFALVPTFDLGGPLAIRELVFEPKLRDFWRDMTLLRMPDEGSLAPIAAARPLVLPFDPTWDRTLARHMVPVGLFARFYPEPRGLSDRRRALEAFTPEREALARAIGAPRDPELVAITASLLRARALALAAAADRDLVGRALDDLRPFAPGDPVAAELVRRVATGKPFDVKDLEP